MYSELAYGLLLPFLGTSLGAAMVFFLRGEMPAWVQKLLLGFASGVMIAASVWSLLIPSIDMTAESGGVAWMPAVVGFLAGMFSLLLFDSLVPHLHLSSDEPEGMKSGLGRSTMLFLAVTLHNIPEGVAAALPTAHGTKSKLKGFLAASVSAVAEPLGALIGWFLLKPIINDTTNGIIFAASAGIMVYLCFDELLPLAYEYCGEKKSVTAIICGFAVMALSLTLLNV